MTQKTSDSTDTTEWQPRIVAFLCNWCSYAGADLAGMSRLAYPAAIKIVRVPCSGRVDPMFVIKSFEQGADLVLVSGCHPGDCHYSEGNYKAMRRYPMLLNLLDQFGIDRGRVRLEWISASEGERFAAVVTEFTEQLKALGPLNWQESIDTLCTGT